MADNKPSNFVNELKNFEKGTHTFEKKCLKNNLVLLLSTTENVLNSFKNKLFPKRNSDKIPTREPTLTATEPEVAKEPSAEPEVATEPTKATRTKRKISSLKLRENVLNEIKNEESKYLI